MSTQDRNGRIDGPPVTIASDQVQLFLDDELLARQQNVERVWHALAKHPANPLFGASAPESALFLFGSVLREAPPGGGPPLFRMWYYATAPPAERDGPGPVTTIAYATSRDGLSWERPHLGLVEIAGSTLDNAVFAHPEWEFIGFSGLIRDPRPEVPASERYKLVVPGLITRPNRRKVYLGATSPDGLHWTFRGELAIEGIVKSDRACFTWDPHRQRYALYCRDRHCPDAFVRRLESHYAEAMSPRAASAAAADYWGRAVALTTSADFSTWTPARQVMRIDLDREPLGLQIYGIAAIPYGGQWVCLWQKHHSLPEQAWLDIGVAHSRDGVTWKREAPVVLPCGSVGQWDRFNQCVSTQVVRVGDELWFYYSGRTYRHGEYRRHTEGTDSGPGSEEGGVHIGLATLRLDGFCSLGAGFDGGTVATRPLALPPGELHLNCRSRWGRVTVEVLDGSGAALPGARSVPIACDDVRRKVTWTEGFALAAHAGRPVRLRFTLENARLFAWLVK